MSSAVMDKHDTNTGHEAASSIRLFYGNISARKSQPEPAVHQSGKLLMINKQAYNHYYSVCLQFSDSSPNKEN
jgi:hypothetical protein